MLRSQAPLDGRRVPKQCGGDTDNTSAFSNNNTRFNNKHNKLHKIYKERGKRKYMIYAPSGPKT
jgi:hypothetical protein